jgi:hypothetical protein
MPLSAGLIKSLGGPTLRSFKEEDENKALSQTQSRIDNARYRLDTLGYEAPEPQDSFLVGVLKNLSRTGYAANNVIREFTSKDAGATPGEFDPIKAFGRGLSLQEQVDGKDIMRDLGLEGDKGIFGGEAKIYNPSVAGAAGLALDILNPLDLLNWLSFGLGKVAVKGGSVSTKTLAKTFGSKVDDIIASAGDISKIQAKNVGDLVGQLSNNSGLVGDDLGKFITQLREGLLETGAKASDKVSDIATKRRLTLGIQNPLTLGRGKEFLKTEVPGTGAIGGALTSLGDTFKKSRLGNELSKRFSTKHIPKDVPDIVVMRNLTGYQLDNIIRNETVVRGGLPFNTDELLTIKGTLDQVKSLNGQATIRNIAEATGFDTADLVSLFESEVPFTFDVIELFDSVRKYHPDLDPKVAFLQSVKLRKVMDDIYGDIPEALRENFKGTIKLPEPVKSFSDTPTMMDNIDQVTPDSPMLSYVFDVRGVDIIVPIQSTMDFNKGGIDNAARIIQAVKQLDEGNLNAIKGQIRAMPGELGVIDGDTIRGYYLNSDIVLRQPEAAGELQKTLPHEFGHSVKEAYDVDLNAYETNAMKGTFIDEYAQTGGVEEDFATSVEWMKNRPEELKAQFPERYNFIDGVMRENRMSEDELLRKLSEQTDRAVKMEQMGPTGIQLEKVIDQIDQYVSTGLVSKPGIEAYKEFKGSMHELYENVSLSKVEDFVQQVEQIFKHVPVEERKAIMDIASGLYDNPNFLAPTFYSKAQKVAEVKMSNKMTSNDLGKMLRSNGVKEEELKWLGINDLLASKETITKDEFMQHMALNNLEIKEVTYGTAKPDELGGLADNLILDPETRAYVRDEIEGGIDLEDIAQDLWNSDVEQFSEMTLGEVRELVHQVAGTPRGFDGMVKYNNWRSQKGLAEDYQELLLTLPEGYQLTGAEKNNPVNQLFGQQPYKSVHWDPENVVAHVRYDTRRVGDEKVLFIQEIQSDWHQAGRKKGYRGEVSPKQRQILIDGGIDKSTADTMMEQLSNIDTGGLTPDDGTEWLEVMGEVIQEELTWPDYLTAEQVYNLSEELLKNFGNLPQAPFAKTWPQMSMKRMIRYAAENGYDRVAWATGKQNADVYGLAKSYSALEYVPNQKRLIATTVDGVGKKIDNVTADNLADYVGEELAERLLKADNTGVNGLRMVEGPNGQFIIEDQDGVIKEFATRDAAVNHMDWLETLNGPNRFRIDPLDREITDLLGEETWAVYTRDNELVDVFDTELDAKKWIDDQSGSKKISGIDLEIGGEGMKGFYDEILPSFNDKYLKKFGIKTEDIDLGGVPDIPREFGEHIFQGDDGETFAQWYLDGNSSVFKNAVEDDITDLDDFMTYCFDVDEAGLGVSPLYVSENEYWLTVSKIKNTLGDKYTAPEIDEALTDWVQVRPVDPDHIGSVLQGPDGENFTQFFIHSDRIESHFDDVVAGQRTIPEAMDDMFNVMDDLIVVTELEYNTVLDRWHRFAQDIGSEYDMDDLDELLADHLVIGDPNNIPSTKPQINKSIKLTDDLKNMVLNEGQPMFKKGAKDTPRPDKLSPDGEAALKAFYNWRQSVVKMYQEAQIPIAEMEKYVPFIPQRPLKRPEQQLLNSIYGTGTPTHEVDPLIQMLSGTDPNLLERTTKANVPSEVNKLLDKPWLTEDAAIAMATRGARAIKTTELSKALDGLVAQYGINYADILSRSTSGGIPSGYKMYTISQEGGRKVLNEVFDSPGLASKGVKSFFIPEEMAKVYNMYADLILGEEKKGPLLKLFDKATSGYKKVAYLWNPGHIFRDFEGNVFNNYLMGVVNPAAYVRSAKLLMNSDSLITVDGVEITVKELLEKSRKIGLLDVGAATAESPYDVMSKLKSSQKNVLQNAGNKYSRAMREGTRKADMYTRFTGLVHNLDQGMSFNEAATEVKKFLFDYFELTPFERKVMKRIIPFYTWMRKNIPLQVEQVMKNPRNYSRIESVMAAAEGDSIDWDERPDYINDSGAFKAGKTGAYVSPNLPFNDLARVPTNLDAFLQLMSGVNPIIKAPIEMATNLQWFNSRPLEEYPDETREITFAGILKMLGVEDKDVPRISKRTTGYLLDQLPLLRNLDTITNPDNPRQTSRASTFLGGPAFYSQEGVEKSRLYEVERILNNFIRKLKDEGIEVPTIREIENEPNKLIKIRDMLR